MLLFAFNGLKSYTLGLKELSSSGGSCSCGSASGEDGLGCGEGAGCCAQSGKLNSNAVSSVRDTIKV